MQELVVREVEEARSELAGARPDAATRADDRDRPVDRDVTERHRQDQVAGRVEDVLVEELRREEERLRGVQPPDEAVHVEAEGEVERVTLEDAALDGLRAGEVEEPRVDEGIEATFDVVRPLQALEAGRPGGPERIGAVALSLAVQGLALEVRRFGAHHGIVGGQREGERGAGDRHAGVLHVGQDLVTEPRGVRCPARKAKAGARGVEIGVVVGEGVGDVVVVEDETGAAAEVVAGRDVEAETEGRIGEAEAAGFPRRSLRDAGKARGLVPERAEPLQEGIGERPELAETIARTEHVERDAPLVESDQETSETGIQRIDVVEQAKDVRLPPGEDLTSHPEKDGTLLDVQVAEEELVSLPAEAAESLDAAVDERLGHLGAQETGDGREIELDRPQGVPLVAEL